MYVDSFATAQERRRLCFAGRLFLSLLTFAMRDVLTYFPLVRPYLCVFVESTYLRDFTPHSTSMDATTRLTTTYVAIKALALCNFAQTTC